MPYSQLNERFQKIRQQTEAICAPLSSEDMVVQVMLDASPPKWHLAHTTWFFETFLLKPNLAKYREFNPDFVFLFNSYYESIGKRLQRAKRGNITRPSIDEVFAYRKYVNEAMLQLLVQELSTEVLTFVELGLQHEHQHQELLVTDLKYTLGTNPTFPVYQEKEYSQLPLVEQEWIKVEAGVYEIGFTVDGFSFDNETPRHRTFLEPYAISNRLVTNEEYLLFMQSGGYSEPSYWLMEGWELKKKENWEAPLYWFWYEDNWWHYTLSGFNPIDLEAPVTHISFYEADAFAKWMGLRLPTEQEWEVACNQVKSTPTNFSENGLFHPQVETEISFLGNCWQWCYSNYNPYPGYEQAAGALGEYNGKFMINQMVLRGGSCATPESHIRTTYRNFFHPDKRWQFSGIRLAKDIRK